MEGVTSLRQSVLMLVLVFCQLVADHSLSKRCRCVLETFSELCCRKFEPILGQLKGHTEKGTRQWKGQETGQGTGQDRTRDMTVQDRAGDMTGQDKG